MFTTKKTAEKNAQQLGRALLTIAEIHNRWAIVTTGKDRRNHESAANRIGVAGRIIRGW